MCIYRAACQSRQIPRDGIPSMTSFVCEDTEKSLFRCIHSIPYPAWSALYFLMISFCYEGSCPVVRFIEQIFTFRIHQSSEGPHRWLIGPNLLGCFLVDLIHYHIWNQRNFYILLKQHLVKPNHELSYSPRRNLLSKITKIFSMGTDLLSNTCLFAM